MNGIEEDAGAGAGGGGGGTTGVGGGLGGEVLDGFAILGPVTGGCFGRAEADPPVLGVAAVGEAVVRGAGGLFACELCATACACMAAIFALIAGSVDVKPLEAVVFVGVVVAIWIILLYGA